jgi:hypothetical protein
MMTGNTFLYGTPLPKPEAPKVVVADPAAPAPAATAEAAKPFEYATYAANIVAVCSKHRTLNG